jgi:hypothetical protein
MTPQERIDERAAMLIETMLGPPFQTKFSELAPWVQERWRRVARLTFKLERDAKRAILGKAIYDGMHADSTADAEFFEIRTQKEIDAEYAPLIGGTDATD